MSDVHQKWNAGQSSGCRRRRWNNFRGMKAKTDPGEELTAPRMKARLPFSGIHSSYQRIQHCPAGVSFQAHQSCGGLRTLAPISLLSQAQTSFSSDCLLHNWLVWVHVLRRPGPISAVNVSLQRAKQVWTPGTVGLHDKSWSEKGRKISKHSSRFVSVFLDGLTSLDLQQLLSWINVRRLQAWEVVRWSDSLTLSILEADDSAGCRSVCKPETRQCCIAEAGFDRSDWSAQSVQVFIDFPVI